MLGQHRIEVLADVRSFHGSRGWPQFNRDEFAGALQKAGVQYRSLKALGGRRHGVKPDSPHTAWTVAAFRSSADHADGEEFARGLEELESAGRDSRTAY